MSQSSIAIYTSEDFIKMRQSGQIAAATLDYIEPFVQEGVTTDELDRLCHDFICDHGAIPAPLGYKGFPKSICTSINNVVCHGIPGDRRLEKGDIINIDVTTLYQGFHGDTSRTFILPPVPQRIQHLVKVTYDAMMRGIQAVAPGSRLGDIGFAIQSYVEAEGFSVVRDFCGHGTGRIFHDAPEVLHFGRPGQGDILKPGYCFTIEPMVNMGRYETKILSDGWTAVTKDRKYSAQFEHTIGVTETGYEIFTQSAQWPGL